MVIDLERRRAATDKTRKRYGGRQFDWSKGVTCVHLARTHLRNMGHRPPTLPRFRSALGARKALAARNWDGVGDMLDSLLPRIAPARMKMGDLALGPGDGGLDAIYVCAGPLKLFGWTTTSPYLAVIDINNLDGLKGAWRV